MPNPMVSYQGISNEGIEPNLIAIAVCSKSTNDWLPLFHFSRSPKMIVVFRCVLIVIASAASCLLGCSSGRHVLSQADVYSDMRVIDGQLYCALCNKTQESRLASIGYTRRTGDTVFSNWITTLHDTLYIDLSINASYGVSSPSSSPASGLLLDVQEPDKLYSVDLSAGNCLYIPMRFSDTVRALIVLDNVVFVVDTSTVLRVPIRK